MEQEFLTCGGVVERADVVHGHCVGLFLGHAAHLHAQMPGLDHDDNAERVEGFVDGVGYLVREALLHLQAVAEGVHHTSQFAQAGDLSVGDVSNVYMPEEGEEVIACGKRPAAAC